MYVLTFWGDADPEPGSCACSSGHQMQPWEAKQSIARQRTAWVLLTQWCQGHRQGGQGKGVLSPSGNQLETVQLQTAYPKTNPPV